MKHLKKISPSEVISEQWIAFEDDHGLGWAQPDAYMVFPEHVVLVEAKLSWKLRAFPQMGVLYAPLLRWLYKKPVVGVLACKKIRFVPEKYAIEELEHLFKFFGEERLYTWHGWGLI